MVQGKRELSEKEPHERAPGGREQSIKDTNSGENIRKKGIGVWKEAPPSEGNSSRVRQ